MRLFQITPLLCLFILLITVVTLLLELTQAFWLPSDFISRPLSWYRLLTYPWINGGLMMAFWNVALIWVAGVAVDHVFPPKEVLWRFVLIPCLIGAFTWAGLQLLFQVEHVTHMIGPIFIAWAYLSFLLVYNYRHWGLLRTYNKIFTVFLTLIFLAAFFNLYEPYFLTAQLAVMAYGFVLGFRHTEAPPVPKEDRPDILDSDWE